MENMVCVFEALTSPLVLDALVVTMDLMVKATE